MQDDARKITYGAMMIAMFAILLAVSFYIPFIGSVTLFFIPLPIILYRLRYDRIPAIFVVMTGIMLSLLIGGIMLIPFALIFGLLGFVIGDTIRSEKSKLYTFMASGLTMLLSVVLTYVATVLFFGINVIDEVMNSLRVAQKQMTAIMVDYGELPANFNKQMEETILFYETALPAIFILASFSMAFVVVVVNGAIVKRLGHDAPKFPSFREMKLPVMTVWCYFLVLLLGLFVEMEQGSMMNLTYVNASVILRILFLLQGISLIHFYMNEMKLPKWGTIMATILAFFFSPVTIILGIFDAGFNVRKWIGRDKAN